MAYKTLLTALLAAVLGCGQMEEVPEAQQAPEIETNDEQIVKAAVKPQNLTLAGYIPSASGITVDGESFDTTEDFYTQQLSRLEADKVEAGYSQDDQLIFDAELGLRDFKRNMWVEITATDDTGYADESSVISGKFKVRFPADADGDWFRVIATKRIAVQIITTEGEVHQWCYNLSSDREEQLEAGDKPLIIRNFRTSFTRYDCRASRDTTIGIPAAIQATEAQEKAQEIPGVPVKAAFGDQTPEEFFGGE